MSKRFVVSILLLLALAWAAAAQAVELTPEGRIFGEFTYNISNYPDWDSRHGDNDLNQFQINRAYLGLKAKFNDQWSARITADVARFDQLAPVYDDNGALVDVKSKKGPYMFFLKYAYGDYRPSDFFGLRFGMLQTAYIDAYDETFGYRYVIKSPSDLWGFDTSADLGAAALGDLGGYGGYYLVVRNGEGYKSPESNKGKAIQARITLTPLPMSEATKGLQLVAAYLYNNVQPSDPRLTTTVLNTLLSYKVMFNQDWGLRLGFGYDLMVASTDAPGADNITSTIIHGFGALQMPLGFGLFGRVDRFDPDTANDKKTHGYRDEQTMVLGGVSYTPLPNLDFAFDYRRVMYTAHELDNQGNDVTQPADAFLGVQCQVRF
jgi:hypothetical protein